MLSLIICSTHTETEANLLCNINDTIGTEYEIIHIDNSHNKYSIFQAYNAGAHKAHGEILCFMHEDIVFHTKGWGAKIEKVFTDNPSIGLLGVAGGKFIPSKGDWRMVAEYLSLHYIQGYQSIEANSKYFTLNSFLNDKQAQNGIIDVVVLDGMWLCMPHKLYSKICFDDKTFSGFHLYDTDISIQTIQTGYRVGVTTEVLIEHRSEGAFRENFLVEARKLQSKWRNVLPLKSHSIGISQQEQDELNNLAEQRLHEHIAKQKKEIDLRQKLSNINISDIHQQLNEEDFFFLSRYTYWRLKTTIVKDKKVNFYKAITLLSQNRFYLTHKAYIKLFWKLIFYNIKNRFSI